MTDHPPEHALSVEPIDDTDRDTAGELQRLGITSHPHVSYEWNGYRYGNAADAIAAAKRAAR